MEDRKIVLVVDDDPGMLEGLQRLLSQHGYEPILLSSAEAFKSHTDFARVACVILDINLGDGSGIELGHHIQSAGISVPFIYITGQSGPCCSHGCAELWVHRIADKALFRAVAD